MGACVVALLVSKTNVITRLQERFRAAPYEAVKAEDHPGSISLGDVRVDTEAASEVPTSAHSRLPS